MPTGDHGVGWLAVGSGRCRWDMVVSGSGDDDDEDYDEDNDDDGQIV